MQEPNFTLDEGLQSDLEQGGIAVGPEQRAYWQDTPFWAKVLSITNFVSGGIQLMSLFWTVPRLRRMLYLSPVDGNNMVLMLIILYLIAITFTLLIGWQLWRYATHLQAANDYSDNEELEISYFYQYRYFKTLGWMAISLIAVFVLGFLALVFNNSAY